jgi:carbon-monoxide dehydrogenase medium subunit
MKSARFRYASPREVDEALALLQAGGPDARLLAGGQSLVPAMNLRLARPTLLVDLGRIAALRGIRRLDDGAIVAGAMSRHRDFERSPLVREALPLLHAAMPTIAHLPIRSRGTIGGSLAHADPAGDWPALCLACDAQMTLRSARGSREVKAEDFSLGFFTTAIAEGEILTETRFPAWPPGRRWGLQKMSRRRGDFAIVGVACVVDLDARGRCIRARIAVFGAAERPLLAEFAAAELSGRVPSSTTLRKAARAAASEISTRSDLHASAVYRSELVEVLTRRAFVQAFAEAGRAK